jgi:Tfp pilus assembly protein PilO
MSQSGRELADNQIKAAELPAVLAANADIRRQLRSARPIPSEADIGGFTVQVSAFCKAAGIGQFSLLPQGARRGDLCTELPITLEFAADFKQCMRVLSKLDTVPRLMQVRTVKMTGKGDGSPLNVKLEISLFHVVGGNDLALTNSGGSAKSGGSGK